MREGGTMSGRRQHFDRWGNCLGCLDEIGRYFDRDGSYGGYLSVTGLFYGKDGLCHGRVDVQGQLWDEENDYVGYFTPPAYGE